MLTNKKVIRIKPETAYAHSHGVTEGTRNESASVTLRLAAVTMEDASCFKPKQEAFAVCKGAVRRRTNTAREGTCQRKQHSTGKDCAHMVEGRARRPPRMAKEIGVVISEQ